MIEHHAASLKLALALHGLRVAPGAERVRAAVAGERPSPTLDLLLPDNVRVATEIEGPTAAASPFVLLEERGRFFVDATDVRRTQVWPIARPRFYERRTSHGTPMWRIATVRGGYLVVSPAHPCGYSIAGRPCPFCVEGARAGSDRDRGAPVADVVEVVRAAFDEGAAEIVYFNTGHFENEDGGIAFLAPYIEAVRRHFDTLLAAQVHPPRSNRWIDRTYAMGVDAISYNLELFDPDVLGRHCIGRMRYIGRERYLEALGYAARIFPKGTVWTDLVAGLEPPAATMAGIDALVGLGVLPVIVPGVSSINGLRPDSAAVVQLLEHLYRAVKQHGLAMGWVRDLTVSFTPFEARFFAGDGAPLATALQRLTHSRPGARVARSLARFRRRLRVRTVSDASEPAPPS